MAACLSSIVGRCGGNAAAFAGAAAAFAGAAALLVQPVVGGGSESEPESV